MICVCAVEIDPEREGLEEVAVLEESDEELLEHMEGRRGKEKPRLRGEIHLDEDTYGGARSSRMKFFGDEQQQDDVDDDADNKDDDSEQSSDDDSQHINGFEDDSTKIAYDGNITKTHIADDEMDALEREMNEVEAAEAHAAEELKERAAKEYRKAQCVKAQKKLWNASLESRILMQKVIQGANRLPGPEIHECFEDVDPAIAQDMEAVVLDAQRTLSDICAILDALSDQHPDIQIGSKKRKAPSSSLNACWESLDERYQSFAPFRDAALDRWHRKTMLSSSGSNMKVLNQGISKQVALLMKDCNRIAERSRVPATQFKGLCQWQASMNRQDTVRRRLLLIVNRAKEENTTRRGVGSLTYKIEILWKFVPGSETNQNSNTHRIQLASWNLMTHSSHY